MIIATVKMLTRRDHNVGTTFHDIQDINRYEPAPSSGGQSHDATERSRAFLRVFRPVYKTDSTRKW